MPTDIKNSDLAYSQTPNEAILAAALTYLRSAELLESENNQLELGVILCASFSIELLLKSISATSVPKNINEEEEGRWTWTGMEYRSSVSGHLYSKLFKALPEEYKTKINNEYQQKNNNTKSVLEELESFDNTFTSWRYSFESFGKSINVTRLIKLSQDLSEIILTLPAMYK